MNFQMSYLAVGHLKKLSIYTGKTPVKPKTKPTAMPLYKDKLRVKPVLALLTLKLFTF